MSDSADSLRVLYLALPWAVAFAVALDVMRRLCTGRRLPFVTQPLLIGLAVIACGVVIAYVTGDAQNVLLLMDSRTANGHEALVPAEARTDFLRVAISYIRARLSWLLLAVMAIGYGLVFGAVVAYLRMFRRSN